MKRVNAYRKLFEVNEETTLKQLKTTYRELVKKWHPDKFPQGHELAEEAEAKSLEIIDAYHFLVSIAPETKEATLAEYIESTESGIDDFHHKGLLMEITFMNGCTYEYFGVNKNVFQKFINSDKLNRFGKRNIFNSYLYRKSKKQEQEATQN